MSGKCLFKLAHNVCLEWTPPRETAFKQDAACMNDAGVSVCPPDMGTAVTGWATFRALGAGVTWSQAPLLLTKIFSLAMRCL